jgi:hypothetical protein
MTKNAIVLLIAMVGAIMVAEPSAARAQDSGRTHELKAIGFVLDDADGLTKPRILSIYTELGTVSSVQMRTRLYKNGEVELIGSLREILTNRIAVSGSAVLANVELAAPTFSGDGYYAERIEVIARDSSVQSYHLARETRFFEVRDGKARSLSSEEYMAATTPMASEQARDGSTELRIRASVDTLSTSTMKHQAARVQ